MSEDSSFAILLVQLREGDERAATRIFEEYAGRLVALARRRLDGMLRGKEDPEDVLQSVFKSFFVRYAAGQFDLENRESLWGLLARITLNKCGHHLEQYQAGKRDVRREAAKATSADESWASWQALARDPTPSEAAVLTETIEGLMKELSERDQKILALTLQGEGIAAVSTQVDCTERTVYRVLEHLRQRLESMPEESRS